MTDQPLRVGITCYPTFGGSGIIATEIGLTLARRGHSVHFICYELPSRLEQFQENVFFHEVEVLPGSVRGDGGFGRSSAIAPRGF